MIYMNFLIPPLLSTLGMVATAGHCNNILDCHVSGDCTPAETGKTTIATKFLAKLIYERLFSKNEIRGRKI